VLGLTGRTGTAPGRIITLPASARTAVLVPVSGGGAPALVTLAATGDAACIIRDGAGQPLCLPFDGKGERLLTADVDGDGRADVLIFGRSMSGIQVLRSGRTGDFTPGQRLFPDMSVSDLQAADLNGDRITDFVLLNWLREELLVLYGIGKGVFTEEISLRLEEEPRHLILATPGRGRSFTIVLSQPRLRRLAVYEGSRTGEFSLRQSIPVAGEVQSLGFADVTGDRVNDLIIGTSDMAAVATGRSATQFHDPVPFGLGRSLLGAVVADMTGDGRPDLITADRDTRRLLVLPAAGPAPAAWPPVYATGASPSGVAVQDVTGDGHPDILLAARTGAAVSLLRNDGEGSFAAQRAIPVQPGPSLLRFASASPGAPLLIAHTGEDAVSILRLSAEGVPDSSMSLSTGAEPYVMRAHHSPAGGLQVLVRYLRLPTGAVSLSLFEEIAGRRFIERSVRPSVPGRIVALTAGARTSAGRYDVFFAARGTDRGVYRIGAAVSSEGFDLRTVRDVTQIADTGVSAVSLLAARVNNDDFPDILVLTGGPRPRIGILFSRGEAAFDDSLTWIADGAPASDATVQVADVDADGRADIAFLEPSQRAVHVLLQRPDGGFRGPLTVAPALDAGSFLFARLSGGPGLDLIVPHRAHGTITVIPDAVRR
jgi:hypothetical protein